MNTEHSSPTNCCGGVRMSTGKVGGTESGEGTSLLHWLEPDFPPPCVHVSGFTPGAKDLFKQENYLALYRLPSDEMVKETILGKLSSITKRRPPLSHMINLFVKDTTTSKAAFFFGHSLGTGGAFPQRAQKMSGWKNLESLWGDAPALPMASADMTNKPQWSSVVFWGGEFFPALAHSRITKNFF